MFFQQVYDKSLSQASYVIGCQANGEAIVIDPRRDIDVYLEVVRQNNLRITHIAETHIHADFLCGSRELAAVTGATLFLSDEGGADWQYEFPHCGLKHGDSINVGNLTFEVLHTPGHTPESISFLLTDHPATDKPVMIFTGDFVFVGDIGRPDLLEKAAGIMGTQEKAAKQMYQSIQGFADLPEYLQVWPGHGAGSACGKTLGSVPVSTVGYEKIRNRAFQYQGQEEEFVNYLLEGQPEPPRYFAMMKHLNKMNRPLLVEVPKYPKLTKYQFLRAYQNGLKVIDTRDKVIFAKGFIPGSLNIQGNSSFPTWMGWQLNYQEPFMLVTEEDQMEDLSRKLMRIGMDNVYGYIPDVKVSGVELQTASLIDLDTFRNLAGKEHIQVVDVRSRNEYEAGHIEGAEHIFVGDLQENLNKIDRNKQVLIYCQAGDRSTIAYSILKRHGFDSVNNYAGGMKEWTECKNKVVTGYQK